MFGSSNGNAKETSNDAASNSKQAGAIGAGHGHLHDGRGLHRVARLPCLDEQAEPASAFEG